MSFMWYLFFCSSIVKLVIACGSLNKNILGGKYEYIDLAFSVDSKIVGINYDGNRTTSSSWPSDERATAPQGGGTQLVAPAEYDDRGANIGEITEEKFIVQLIFLNLSSKVKENSSFILRMNDLENLLNSDMLHQLSSWPSLLVFAFGWSKYYRDYGTHCSNGTFSCPAIGNDVTDWLTKNESTKKVVGVGTDLPFLDGGLNIMSSMDITLAKAGVYVIESLNLTVSLPAYKCITVVSPFKIAEASRVPTSVVAICPKDSVPESNANTEHDHTSNKDKKKHAGGHMSKRHTFEHRMHEHEHDKEHEHKHATEHEHKHATGHEHKHTTEHEHKNATKHEDEHDTEHKSEHRSKRHACEHRGHYEHEEKKEEESNGQDNSDKKDIDKKGNTQSSGKGDKTDQQGNNTTKPTIPIGSGNKESSLTANLPQKVIDGIQSIKNKLKIRKK